jgi:uncharacterized protein with NAD-binding domain and iron-sulfur cluster
MAVDWMLSAFNMSPHAADAETTSRSRELPPWLESEVSRAKAPLGPKGADGISSAAGGSKPSVFARLKDKIHQLAHMLLPAFISGPATKSAAPASGAEPSIISRLEHTFLHLAHSLLSSTDSDPRAHSAVTHDGILWLLEEFLGWFYRHIEQDIAKNDVTRRLWILVNFTYAAVRGVLADGVLYKGFRCIDDLDFAEWLKKHGATELTLNSALVRGYYDYFFAYKQGDPNQPSLAAGAGLAHLLRLTMTYKTAIFWEMQAGMGDTVFAPLYLVLKKRGVRFKFFHFVENLGLSADKKSIETIRMAKQVNLKRGSYDPLIEVKGLPCWPSDPLYDQITEGEELRRNRINLESPWSPWKNVAEITLRSGVDFDKVILGITLAGLQPICTELVAASDAWKKMFEHVHTVQTVAAQVWFRPDATQLGWKQPRPVLTAYAHPLDSAADFSHLLDRENWPANAAPETLWYFCGALEDAAKIPGDSDHAFPDQQNQRAKGVALQWLLDNSARLWPAACPQNSPTGLDWSALNDPQGRSGEARFDAQYWRANISPGERYVLTLPGDSQYRLSADGSGFKNLYLTGDWVYTGLGGCVEGAVIAGMMASRAVAGYPEKILCETDVWMAESTG